MVRKESFLRFYSYRNAMNNEHKYTVLNSEHPWMSKAFELFPAYQSPKSEMSSTSSLKIALTSLMKFEQSYNMDAWMCSAPIQFKKLKISSGHHPCFIRLQQWRRRHDQRGTDHISQSVFNEQETARLLKDDAQNDVVQDIL